MRVHGITPNLSFCAYKSRFSEKLEETLAARPEQKTEDILSVDFKDVFYKQMTSENFIGAGFYNKVYKIDDFYVMRLPYHSELDAVSARPGSFYRPLDNQVNRVASNLKCYYGNPVAVFGNVQILKNAIGDNTVVYCKGKNPKMLQFVDKLDYYSNIYLKQYAELPQKAYDNLAHDFKYMNGFRTKNDYTYTYDILNPGNFIKVGDEIRVVDDIDSENAVFYDKNELSTLLSLFFLDIDSIPNSALSPHDIANMHKIFKKCIIAGEHAGLSWNSLTNGILNYTTLLENIKVKASFEQIYSIVKNAGTPEHKDYDQKLDTVLTTFLKAHTMS